MASLVEDRLLGYCTEASNIEYEVEIYAIPRSLPDVLSMAKFHEQQEQWGIYVPKTEKNSSDGNIRVRKSVDVEGNVSYVSCSKTKLPDGSRQEEEFESSEIQFNQFRAMASDGLIKTRYQLPISVSGKDIVLEIDVFKDARWIKIDAEVDPGTKISKDDIPFEIDEIVIVDPSEPDPTVKEKVAKIYDTFLTPSK